MSNKNESQAPAQNERTKMGITPNYKVKHLPETDTRSVAVRDEVINFIKQLRTMHKWLINATCSENFDVHNQMIKDSKEYLRDAADNLGAFVGMDIVNRYFYGETKEHKTLKFVKP